VTSYPTSHTPHSFPQVEKLKAEIADTEGSIGQARAACPPPSPAISVSDPARLHPSSGVQDARFGRRRRRVARGAHVRHGEHQLREAARGRVSDAAPLTRTASHITRHSSHLPRSSRDRPDAAQFDELVRRLDPDEDGKLAPRLGHRSGSGCHTHGPRHPAPSPRIPPSVGRQDHRQGPPPPRLRDRAARPREEGRRRRRRRRGRRRAAEGEGEARGAMTDRQRRDGRATGRVSGLFDATQHHGHRRAGSGRGCPRHVAPV
jgi:hypothetical protein